MPSKDLFHLIVDPPAVGAWNMAVDEVLLDGAVEAELPTLRIYRWERPTLSLGYFQDHQDRHTHPESEQVELVRRQSGGGAILHDQEITYSLTVPGQHPLAAEPLDLYETMHRALVAWLSGMEMPKANFRVEMFAESDSSISESSQPFLCFRRRSSGDVVLIDGDSETDHKVIGSAQRRRRGAILQHGSILWRTSDFAQNIYGFANLTGCERDLTTVQEELIERLPSLLGVTLERIGLSEESTKAAASLQAERYEQDTWTKRR